MNHFMPYLVFKTFSCTSYIVLNRAYQSFYLKYVIYKQTELKNSMQKFKFLYIRNLFHVSLN